MIRHVTRLAATLLCLAVAAAALGGCSKCDLWGAAPGAPTACRSDAPVR